MRKSSFLGVAVIFSILIFVSYCYAVSDASTYKITVQSVQMRNSVTGTWVTIASPNQEVDITSVGQNSVAASFANDITIPVGTYDNFKMVISEAMTVSGTDAGNSSVEGGALTITGGAGAGSTATWGGAQPNATLIETVDTISAVGEGEVTFTLNLDTGDADNYIEVYRNGNLATPITITATSIVSMWFDFDTQSTIQHLTAVQCIAQGHTDLGANGLMVFFPPQSGTRVNITVDGTTTTITEAQTRIDF